MSLILKQEHVNIKDTTKDLQIKDIINLSSTIINVCTIKEASVAKYLLERIYHFAAYLFLNNKSKLSNICTKFSYTLEYKINLDDFTFANVLDKNNKTIYSLLFSERVALIFYNNLDSKFEDFYKCLNEQEIINSQIVDLYLPKLDTSDNTIDFKRTTFDAKQFGIIEEDLYPDIDINILANEYIKSSEPILIISGIPGCGKTTFAKYLIRKIHSTLNYGRIPEDFDDISVINTNDIKVLENVEFWNKIICQNSLYNILLLDDIALSLIRTQTSRNPFVDNLLSLSGGLVESEMKIVITTNQEKHIIDPAILRPGRCFDNINLKPLSVENAKNIWINRFKLSEEYFVKEILNCNPFGSDYITQANLISHKKSLETNISKKTYYKK